MFSLTSNRFRRLSLLPVLNFQEWDFKPQNRRVAMDMNSFKEGIHIPDTNLLSELVTYLPLFWQSYRSRTLCNYIQQRLLSAWPHALNSNRSIYVWSGWKETNTNLTWGSTKSSVCPLLTHCPHPIHIHMYIWYSFLLLWMDSPWHIGSRIQSYVWNAQLSIGHS